MAIDESSPSDTDDEHSDADTDGERADGEFDDVNVDASGAELEVDDLHVPDEVSPALRRFVIANALLRLGIPIVAFFTIVAPLGLGIADGQTSDIYALTVVRPSKEIVLWGGALWRIRPGDVDLWLLFASYAPLMIVMNWPFLYLGRAYGPALARGQGPRWLQRSVSPENLAIARTLLARKGPQIAILGRIAALPPTVMAAAAGTSDVKAWRYQLADTIGGVLAWAITVGIGMALGEAWERAGTWVTVGSVVVLVAAISWMTQWLRREAEKDDELAALTHHD